MITNKLLKVKVTIKVSCSVHFTYFFLLHTITKAYFTHLLNAMTASNALFELCLTFLYFKFFKCVCCLGNFHLQIVQNLLELCPFCYYGTRVLPS